MNRVTIPVPAVHPTMRLFRQTAAGDRRAPFTAVAQARVRDMERGGG